MYPSQPHPPVADHHPSSARRLCRAAPLADRPAAPARIRARVGLRARLAAIALLACCTALPLSARAADCPHDDVEPRGPGAVFASVEAAALDALLYAHREATLTDRLRLGVGVIYRVADGYAYGAVKRSAALSPLQPHRVRYPLRAIDVARYVIPPRSRQPHINRSNEQPSRHEKQIVDEIDPEHRPLYQLTPSLNVVRYERGGRTTVVAHLDDLARKAVTLASPAAPRAEREALCATRSTTFLARSASVGPAD